MKPLVTWIVVADGDQAKVFAHDGTGKGLRAVPEMHMQQDRLGAKDIMADRPGRAGSGGSSGSRSAMESSADPVEQRERKFVQSLADALEQKRAEGAFQRLVIAAAPNALGDLRPALSHALRKTVLAELPKDLVNIPTPQLAQHFESVLAV